MILLEAKVNKIQSSFLSHIPILLCHAILVHCTLVLHVFKNFIFWRWLQIPVKDCPFTGIWANKDSYSYLVTMNLRQLNKVINLDGELCFSKEATILIFFYKIKIASHLTIKDLFVDEQVNIQKHWFSFNHLTFRNLALFENIGKVRVAYFLRRRGGSWRSNAVFRTSSLTPRSLSSPWFPYWCNRRVTMSYP